MHIKQNRPSWDEYFIKIAEVVATRSIDAETQVGCVITKNNHIVSTGYNGFPSGIDEESLPNTRPGKYPLIIHAEANAIAHSKCDLEGATAYVTISPCQDCAKLLIASGIKRVVFKEVYANASLEPINLLALSGIDIEDLSEKLAFAYICDDLKVFNKQVITLDDILLAAGLDERYKDTIWVKTRDGHMPEHEYVHVYSTDKFDITEYPRKRFEIG